MTFSSETITTIILTSAILAGVRQYMNLTRESKGSFTTRILFSLLSVIVGGIIAAISIFILVFSPVLMVIVVIAATIFLYWAKGKEVAEKH